MNTKVLATVPEDRLAVIDFAMNAVVLSVSRYYYPHLFKDFFN